MLRKVKVPRKGECATQSSEAASERSRLSFSLAERRFPGVSVAARKEPGGGGTDGGPLRLGTHPGGGPQVKGESRIPRCVCAHSPTLEVLSKGGGGQVSGDRQTRPSIQAPSAFGVCVTLNTVLHLLSLSPLGINLYYPHPVSKKESSGGINEIMHAKGLHNSH